MSAKLPNPIVRRNAILFASGIFFVLAVLSDMPVLAQAFSPFGLLGVGLTVIGGIFAAMGIREFAHLALPTTETPWYVRPATFPFLVSMVMLVNILYIFVCDHLLAFLDYHKAMPLGPRSLTVISATLLGIVLIDWPRGPSFHPGEEEPEDEPCEFHPSPSPPRKPKFRPFDPQKQPGRIQRRQYTHRNLKEMDERGPF